MTGPEGADPGPRDADVPPRPTHARGGTGWAGRLAWFAAIWLASIAALAVVAYAIRLAIN
ncbi:hypothetical protein BV394_04505 [Brevirhabdus pacifica]|uniref:Uncharacterized protein n=1 Tax=Brevirhabdus pacifica TaxID=1267768 RepID=A0A1U7DGG6_9RHOB|nr:DUF2474 domain-containing protein [Brevirhabdus pacifica]APX89072.1 hypothetical protein BV394_04505 [Brevirhabdus pacifica]OWU76865.1 hypothetical protein ATO5_11785 [Loktanella sp. 22II-4b]PJJ86351.1 uncharacterized protein DUF2474 [Brevirhabdus pacifica]